MLKELKQEEIDFLRKIEQAVDASWDELSSWEQKFIEDKLEDLRRYGKRMQLSALQWDKIANIAEKIL